MLVMRIYVAYQFTGQDKKYLKHLLVRVSEKLHELGHQTFIFYRDVQKWSQPVKNEKTIINSAFNTIDNCDAILALLENQKRSEGTILEIGYSKGKGKKVFIAINDRVGKKKFLYKKGIADKVVFYKDVDQLISKLNLLK